VFQNFAHLVNVPVFDVDDAAFAFIRFDNGAVVQLETSWAGNLADDIPTGRYFGRERRNSIVYGTKATVRLDPLTLFEDQGGQLVDLELETEDDEGQSFQLQLGNFVAAIRGEAEPINNSEQAVALMEMLDAIYTSSAAGREVPIV
jgi:predicted dehydrogenase